MKAKHVMIGGSSGGGKTTYAREMYAKHNGVSIWVNHNDEDGLTSRDVDGARVARSFSEAKDLVTSCTTQRELRRLRIDYRCSDPTKGVADSRQLALAIADATDAEVCTQIIVDEGHTVLPDDEDTSAVKTGNPLAKILHEDRDENVKGVVMTQDPTELYYPPIKNCKYFVWCGEVKTWHRGYLRYYGLNEVDLPTEDWRYVVIKPTDPPQVIDRGTTSEEYA
ncbi:hypothetical protein [Halobellus limi]|uniref:Uncharacterized protein n=1 Tax=Halobellus limi TaxID=699433 RepID=A0A1H5T1B0_9EURY|nr:hypothetical protein [Halobellus limi]QCC47434.1 hypothetical protein DV707_07035 [Halobellus limi]SEF56565.1 hypothetical protein SAMN04488133_0141 [Halobellus limi]